MAQIPTRPNTQYFIAVEAGDSGVMAEGESEVDGFGNRIVSGNNPKRKSWKQKTKKTKG